MAAGPAASIATLLRELDRTQWLPVDLIQEAQFHQLRLLAERLAATSPHFLARLRGAGLRPKDLGTPEGLSALAPLTRREVQDAGPHLFSTAIPADHGRITEHKTSGSTGQPVAIRRTTLNVLVWSALTIRDHLWRQIDFRGRISSCRFAVKSPTTRRTWGQPIALLFESGRSQAIPLLSSLEDILDNVAAFSPHLLQLYPSVLGPLAELARERAVELPHLRHVHTIGETLTADTRTTANAVLGVPVWDTYSCEEVGNVALECPDVATYHVMAESLIVEVLDDQDRPCAEGRPGRVVVTDLHNTATALVRYELGDYAELGSACTCGRGLPTLRRIAGRHRNLVLLPDGTRHWPVVGIHRFRDIAPIRQFQFVQRERDAIDVQFVIDEPPTSDVEARLAHVIRDALGYPFELRFSWQRDPIRRGPSGKFEEFVCAVS